VCKMDNSIRTKAVSLLKLDQKAQVETRDGGARTRRRAVAGVDKRAPGSVEREWSDPLAPCLADKLWMRAQMVCVCADGRDSEARVLGDALKRVALIKLQMSPKVGQAVSAATERGR